MTVPFVEPRVLSVTSLQTMAEGFASIVRPHNSPLLVLWLSWKPGV